MLQLLLSIFFTVILIEVGLRIFPGLIPLDLLILFNDEPRTQVARSRGLPTRWDVVQIERDDGGPDFGVFKPHTIIAWPIRDNGTESTVMMDDIGFCNPPENSYHLPNIDIITLGDSFTICHAVDPQQTWTSKLSVLTGLSAYNLGKGGIGIHEYIQILKQFGLQKSPHVVIMNIYEGNDFRDARSYYRNIMKQQNSTDQDQQPASTPTFLQQKSYAYNLIEAGLIFWQQANYFNTSANLVTQTDYERINFRYRLVFSDKEIAWNLENTDTDEVEYAQRLNILKIESGVFESVEDALRTFVELSQQYNFTPIVSYTPSAHTAYADYVIFDDPALTNLMPWFSQMQRDYLAKMSNELGYTFIDLTPALQTAAQVKGSQDLLYYRYDLHLTPSGHAVVAKALSQTLNELKLIHHQ